MDFVLFELIVIGKKGYNWEQREKLAYRLETGLNGMNIAIKIITVVLFVAHLFNMVYPTNRLLYLFKNKNYTSYSIHARRAEHNSYVLLIIADMICTATLSLFFVYILFYNKINNRGIYTSLSRSIFKANTSFGIGGMLA